MDTPNMNPAPQDNTQAPATNVASANSAAVFDEKGGVGPVVGIIIVVVLLVIGGVYYYMRMQGDITGIAPAEEQAASDTLSPLPPDTATQALQTQGTSNNISDIEADLNSTDLTNLSSDLSAVVGGAAQ